MNRFYTPQPLSNNLTVTLPDTVYHHWVRVLRAAVGDTATLFNGNGGEYTAQLTHIDKHQATAKLSHFNADNRTPKHFTTLGLVMSKGERMDYAIQKATELGVGAIQLLTSERCEMRLKYARDQKKIEHWQQIAISACEQCGMNKVPMVLPPVALSDWLALNTDELKLVTAPTPALNPIPAVLPAKITLLIGPEGGLSASELTTAESSGFLRWQLGERVLRTETAPIAAISILNFIQT